MQYMIPGTESRPWGMNNKSITFELLTLRKLTNITSWDNYIMWEGGGCED